MTERPCPPELIEVGRLAGLHGVRGAFRVISYTRPRGQICRYRRWWIATPDQDWTEYAVDEARSDGTRVTARLAGIDDRDVARTWLEAQVAVSAHLLPRAAADEYYWRDLIGLRAENLEGVPLGSVERLFETPANDVLVIRDGETERLVPFVRDHFVMQVDLASGRIVLDWDPRD